MPQDDGDDEDQRCRKTRKSRTVKKRNPTKSNSYSADYFNDNNSKLDNSTGASQQNYGTSPQSMTENDFQSGDFIICRQEVLNDWPALWRVDGKSLLQKFEPFQNDNKMIYRSISTVSLLPLVCGKWFAYKTVIYTFIFVYSMQHGHRKVVAYIY